MVAVHAPTGTIQPFSTFLNPMPIDYPDLLAVLHPGGSIYDVRTFGALGDGLTDDSDAIKLCIAAAPSGATVRFPPTTAYYKVNTSGGQLNAIVISKSLTLVIDGRVKATYGM